MSALPGYCRAVRELAKLAALAGVPVDVILKGALIGALDAIDPEQRILAAEFHPDDLPEIAALYCVDCIRRLHAKAHPPKKKRKKSKKKLTSIERFNEPWFDSGDR